jgi:hypothetical protein
MLRVVSPAASRQAMDAPCDNSGMVITSTDGSLLTTYDRHTAMRHYDSLY